MQSFQNKTFSPKKDLQKIDESINIASFYS